MRLSIAAVTAAVLFASSALAADDNLAPTNGPLAPGKPAGVKQAQDGGTPLLWVLGAGLVIGGIILVATHSDNNNNTATSGTSP